MDSEGQRRARWWEGGGQGLGSEESCDEGRRRQGQGRGPWLRSAGLEDRGGPGRAEGGCRPGWGSEVGQGEGWRWTGPAEAGWEEAMGRRRTRLPGYGYGTVTMVGWAGGWRRAVQSDEGGMGWLRAGIGHCRETEADSYAFNFFQESDMEFP